MPVLPNPTLAEFSSYTIDQQWYRIFNGIDDSQTMVSVKFESLTRDQQLYLILEAYDPATTITQAQFVSWTRYQQFYAILKAIDPATTTTPAQYWSLTWSQRFFYILLAIDPTETMTQQKFESLTLNQQLYLILQAAGGVPVVPGPDTIPDILAWWPQTYLAANYTNGMPITLWEDVENGNDLAQNPTNNALFDTAVLLSGKAGGVFDNDSYLTSTIPTGGLIPFTFGAVIRPTNLGGANVLIGGDTNGCVCFRISATGRLQLLQQSVALIGEDAVHTIAVNTPYFVAVTYSAAGVWTFYVNGVVGSSGTSLFASASGNLIFAGREGETEDFFGNQWEAFLYSRDLTPAEIATLAAYTQSLFGV